MQPGRCKLMLAALLCAAGWAGVSNADPPAPIFTRLKAFRIPFNQQAAEAEGASAVQLWVSIDGGANWRIYTTTRRARRLPRAS